MVACCCCPHRHKGIQRVALLDFDVHHGNGTEACVAATAPRTLRFPYFTPLSEGVQVGAAEGSCLQARGQDGGCCMC
jgi:hypothetical protein